MSTLNSDPIVPPFWDLFKRIKNTDIAKSSFWNIYDPISTLSNNSSPLKFKINKPSYDQFIDWDECYIELFTEITGYKKDGKDPEDLAIHDAIKASPVNNIAHSLFKKIEIEANNTVIASVDNYAYVAYLNTLFNYDKASKSGFCRIQGWIDEAAGTTGTGGAAVDKMNNIDSTTTSTNAHKRKQQYMYSNGNLILKPFTSIFHLDTVMIPGVEFKISLERYANGSFYMMGQPTSTSQPFEIRIKEAKLHVHFIQVFPDYGNSINETRRFDHVPISYNVIDQQIISADIATGSFHYDVPDLFQGQHPCRICAMIVPSAAFSGSLSLNPFRFEHANISEISLKKDSINFPCPPIYCNFSTRECARAYYLLLRALNSPHPACPDFQYNEFLNGFTLFNFDLSPDQAGGTEPHAITNQNVTWSLNIKFRSGTPTALTLLVYYEVDKLINIDPSNSISTEKAFF